MAERVETGIYYDERCTKFPYFVNLMRHGKRFYRKFATLEEAQFNKQSFIDRMALTKSGLHPCILRRDDELILEVSFLKTYPDTLEGQQRSKRVAEILDQLMDEDV